MSKPDDMLSEQKHLRHSLNLCGYKNSIIDHAIRLNKRHNTKIAISIQKSKCYFTPPYHGEPSVKIKGIFQDDDVQTQFSRNSPFHPNV